MEHITLKAAAAQVTDQGVFEAVISTENADREKDVVSADGMVAALKAWNRPIPLAWHHSTRAEDIIGSVEPRTIRAEKGEVIAQGKIDLDSTVGKEAWRSFKSRTIGFSFGYIVGKSETRDGGGRHITELDIFEITATPTPMNNDTRVLATKAADVEEKDAATDDVAEKLDALSDALEAEVIEPGQVADRLREIATVLDEMKAALADLEQVKDAHEKLKLDLLAAGVRVPEDGEPNEQAIEEHAATLTEEDVKKFIDEPQQPDVDEKDRAKLDLMATGVAPGEKAAEIERVADSEVVIDGVGYPATELLIGDAKAVWSAAYVNDLPDSAFLYVEGGGTKDEEGKTTPRSLRHFPYKDAGGAVDLPHLRNALARIPQSNLPQDVKDRLTSKAQSILDNQKAIDDVRDDDPREDKSTQDPPRDHADDRQVYDLVTDGINMKAPRQAEPAPAPEIPETRELDRHYYDLMLATLLPEEGK